MKTVIKQLKKNRKLKYLLTKKGLAKQHIHIVEDQVVIKNEDGLADMAQWSSVDV